MSQVDERAIQTLIERSKTAREPLTALSQLADVFDDLCSRRPEAPILAPLLDAMVALADRSGDRARYRELLDTRARWADGALGATAPGTLRAWYELGDIADEDFDWPAATEAWRHVVRAPADEGTPKEQRRMVANAARHLGARLLSPDPATALELFERDLAIRESLAEPGYPSLALSLDNVATAREALGEMEAAAAVRSRQLSLTEEALGSGHPNVASLRARIESIHGAR